MSNTSSEKRMKSSLQALILLFLLSQTSCLRYVPSRSELEEKNGKLPLNTAGPDEFHSYETELKRRLYKLQTDRAYWFQNQFDTSYRIGAGDVLKIEVFGFAELNTAVEVTPEGSIFLELIGEVQASGQTLARLRADIARRLIKYIREPQVRLSVEEYLAHRVAVVGEVAKPGIYSLKRHGQLLTELLSEAGGRTEKAGWRIILIPGQEELLPVAARALGPGGAVDSARAQFGPLPEHVASQGTQNRQRSGVEVDLEDLTGTIDKAPLLLALKAGDTIIIPEAGTYEVDGEVEKPGSFKLASRTSAGSAVAAAGGFTYSADVNAVEIIRDVGSGKKALLTVDLEKVGVHGAPDIRLRDGDLVRIPSHPSRFRTRQAVEVLNRMFRVGISRRVE